MLNSSSHEISQIMSNLQKMIGSWAILSLFWVLLPSCGFYYRGQDDKLCERKVIELITCANTLLYVVSKNTTNFVSINTPAFQNFFYSYNRLLNSFLTIMELHDTNFTIFKKFMASNFSSS